MNKEQKIANLSTSDNPPSRVQSTTTIGTTQEEQKKPQEDIFDEFEDIGYELLHNFMDILIAWTVAAILIKAGWMFIPTPFALLFTIFVVAFLYGYLTHS